MCGIVGGISQREVSEILLEGLRRLEYRGYDSAGMAVLAAPSVLKRVRALGKVQCLADEMEQVGQEFTAQRDKHGADAFERSHKLVVDMGSIITHLS